jgi:Protein of unknown function (DUF3011)
MNNTASNRRFFTLLAVPALLLTLVQPTFSAAYNIRCESKGRKHNTCNADMHGRVKVDLVEQTSNTKCMHGSNWGESESGVWVDHGCSGVFRISDGHGGRFNRDGSRLGWHDHDHH